MLPGELGAGPYQLIAGIYDPTQEGAPRLKTADGVDHVMLRSTRIVTSRLGAQDGTPRLKTAGGVGPVTLRKY